MSIYFSIDAVLINDKKEPKSEDTCRFDIYQL